MSIWPAVILAQAPTPPANVGFEKLSVGFMWDANTETDLAGYKFYYGTAPRTYGAPVTLGLVTTYSVVGLLPGNYYFAVTAFNTANLESGYSNEVQATILPIWAPTQRVFGPVIVNMTSTSAQLSWKTDVAMLSRIEYQKTGGEFNSLVVSLAPVTDHHIRLSGLTGQSIYSYTVINESGTDRTQATGSFRTR